MATTAGEATALLHLIRKGAPGAEDRLVSLVYAELHRIAASFMRRERADHTLQATALVNEAYLRLTSQRDRSWECRAHFVGVAANVMRQILIDHARAHLRQKRGGGEISVSLDEQCAGTALTPIELVDLDDSLKRLAKVDPRQSRIVELRFFGGLSVEEVAHLLGISPKTVKRDWSVAKAWLYSQLRGSYEPNGRQLGKGQGTV